jgi:hypothetical protein
MFLSNPAKRHVMASVHRRPASKFWHAFFRDGEGRLIDKSTRLKDRKRAQRVAETLETAAQRKKSAQNVRAAFAQIFQDRYQETMSIAPRSDAGGDGHFTLKASHIEFRFDFVRPI